MREAVGATDAQGSLEGAGGGRNEGGREIVGGRVHEGAGVAGGDGSRETPQRGVFQNILPGQSFPTDAREGGCSGLKA